MYRDVGRGSSPRRSGSLRETTSRRAPSTRRASRTACGTRDRPFRVARTFLANPGSRGRAFRTRRTSEFGRARRTRRSARSVASRTHGFRSPSCPSSLFFLRRPLTVSHAKTYAQHRNDAARLFERLSFFAVEGSFETSRTVDLGDEIHAEREVTKMIR